MDNYFLNIVSSAFAFCFEKNKPYISNFLSINEQDIFILESKKYPSISLSFDGGFEGAEYKKAILNPTSYSVDSNISILRINFNLKYLSLSHRNILGSLIHLGIARDRIGDIFINDGSAFVAVSSNLVPFIIENLQTIHHQPVEICLSDEKIILEDKGIEKTIFVASARLDAIISMAFNLSRDEGTQLIKREMVKVNQKIVLKAFQTINVCDIISVAHKGRIKIIDDSAVSRSGRIVMKIKIYR